MLADGEGPTEKASRRPLEHVSIRKIPLITANYGEAALDAVMIERQPFETIGTNP